MMLYKEETRLELLMFHMEDCPYCRSAERALKKLCSEDPRYRSVPVRRVDETREPELASSYDYWYVPSVFMGDRKLYEARPGQSDSEILEKMRDCLEEALRGEQE